MQVQPLPLHSCLCLQNEQGRRAQGLRLWRSQRLWLRTLIGTGLASLPGPLRLGRSNPRGATLAKCPVSGLIVAQSPDAIFAVGGWIGFLASLVASAWTGCGGEPDSMAGEAFAAPVSLCYGDGMRGAVFQLLVLFSVLCAGIHAPAAAHGDHDASRAITIELSDAHQAHEREDTSSDPAQEVFHHHHCPAAMAVDCAYRAETVRVRRDTLRPAEVMALVSRASPPLVEPPLA
jgi:hypothetical protein